MLARIAALIAALLARSGCLLRGLARVSFKGKSLIVNQMTLPPQEVQCERDGISYRLELSDDVQRLIYFNVFERSELAVLWRLLDRSDTENPVCVDAGANVGFYSLQIANRYPKSVVHAFEPDPDVYERLVSNCALNSFGERISCHRLALCSTDGEADFHRSSADHTGWGSLTRFEDFAGQVVPVETMRLDRFIQNENISHVDLLKIDVEANEFDLLAGAQNAFENKVFDYILIEFNGPRMAQKGKTFSDYTDFFERFGYTICPRLNGPLVDKIRMGTIDPSGVCINLLFAPQNDAAIKGLD